MSKQRWMWTAAVALLAACGGDEPRPAADGETAAAPADSAPGVPAATPTAEPAPQDEAPVPQASGDVAPTRADSIAAAREDVTPEWKQRQRSMASYADCMEQTKGAEPAVRRSLEAACSRLPDAPK
jgi:hypothetical protein